MDTSRRIKLTLVAAVSGIYFLHAQVSINDFRIPQSKSSSMFLNFYGSLSGGSTTRQNFYVGSLMLSSYENKSGYGSLSGQSSYYTLEFDEDGSNEFQVRASSDVSYNSNDFTQKDTNAINTKGSSYATSFSFSPEWNYSYYLIPDQIYVLGTFDGFGRYSFRHNESESVPSGASVNSSDRSREYSVNVGVGIGIGRVRDGQVVFRVLRLLEKLQEDGALLRELDKNEIMGIVDKFGRTAEYSTNHERFSKFFARDIFAILDSAGALKDGSIAPYSVVRSEEVMGERILPRIFGWRGQLTIQHLSSQTESYGYFTYLVKAASDYGVSLVEYGYSISLNAHFHSIASARIPLNGDPRSSDVSFIASVIYEAGERIEVVFGTQYSDYSSPQSVYYNDKYRYFTRGLFVDSNYFIEDHVTLNINAEYRNSDSFRSTPSLNLESSESNSVLYLSFGLRYRFF